jgi:hypothetical protein
MVARKRARPIWGNTDPLWLGQDLEVDGSSPLQQLRLGLARRYQCHFVIDPIVGYERLNVDQLGAGVLGFEKVGTPQVGGGWTNHLAGLTISAQRPQQQPPGSAGYFAAIDVSNTHFNANNGAFPGHGRFVVIASFRRPVQDPAQRGTWAPALLLETVRLTKSKKPGSRKKVVSETSGVSCQFRSTGTRLNVPGIVPNPNRLDLPPNVTDRITNVANPATFRLILRYNRAATPNGAAYLLVDQDIVDSIPFEYVTKLGPLGGVKKINKVLFGVGTATGGGYTAQVDALDVQIWVPPFPHV